MYYCGEKCQQAGREGIGSIKELFAFFTLFCYEPNTGLKINLKPNLLKRINEFNIS